MVWVMGMADQKVTLHSIHLQTHDMFSSSIVLQLMGDAGAHSVKNQASDWGASRKANLRMLEGKCIEKSVTFDI